MPSQKSLSELGIKAVALDIYGTVLATNDSDNSAPPRDGIGVFFDRCDEKEIKIYGSSDADVENVIYDLKICFEKYPKFGMSIYRFAGFYKMDQLPHKDFLIICKRLNINSLELFVIGDNPDKDIWGASECGCLSKIVPEYWIVPDPALKSIDSPLYDSLAGNVSTRAGYFDFELMGV